jgi:Na+-driven multidrug efflux pump
MGIAGAAFATTIARAVELRITNFENGKTGVVRVRWKYFHSVRLKRDYYRYIMPVLANELVWGCGFTMWLIVISMGAFAVFVLQLPVMAVYFWLNLDEFIKLSAVYRHYKQYKWVKNLTINQQEGEAYESKGKNVKWSAL